MTVLTERVFGSIFEHFFKLAGTCVGRSAFCQGCILLEILDSCRVLDALISISTMDNIGIHVLVYPPFQSSIALISISAMANIEFHFLVYPPLHCSRCSYFNIDHGQY